jgi:hypothetical protein
MSDALIEQGAINVDMDSFYAAQNDNVDAAAEIRISRLALLQPQSPEITKQVRGYSPGMIVDNQSRTILSYKGKPPWMVAAGIPESELNDVHYLPVLPVMKLPTEFIKWTPRSQRKPGDPDFEFKTFDPSHPGCLAGLWPPRGKWGKLPDQEGKPPPVTENINICLLPLSQDLALAVSTYTVATFSRTSFNTGRNFVKALETHKLQRIFPWGRVYYLYSKQEQKDNNVWYEFLLASGPESAKSCPNLIAIAASMGRHLSDKDLGKARQMAMLNAAEQVSEHADVADGANGDTIDGTATVDANGPGTGEPF